MAKFTIPSECHISRILPKFHRNKSTLSFSFAFTSNCIYDIGINHNEDCNKLYGMSFGLIHNTTTILGRLFKRRANSFRLGWNCAKQNRKIQLYAYYYNNGERRIEYISDIDLNKYYGADIYFDRTSNEIYVHITHIDSASSQTKVNNKYSFDFRKCKRWGLWLNFYFGGKLPAPHRMTAFIENHI